MKAITYYAHGGVDQLRLQDLPVPEPRGEEVLIRVGAVSLNGFDPQILVGSTRLRTPFPMIPGGDFAGEIVELGSQVNRTKWKTGDRVCPFPYVEGRGMMGETTPGACREYVNIPEGNLLRMPEGLSFADAAALPVAYGTALRMMETRGQVKASETVLILGASGGVGTACVQLGVNIGAEVIACCGGKWKAERLQELGAAHVIDTSQRDLVRAVHELKGKPKVLEDKGGVDVVVNYIGGETWVPSLKVLARRGRILVCGATAGYAPLEDLRYIWSFEHQIIGSNAWTAADQVRLMNMVVEGRLEPVIHACRSLAETPLAMQELIDRRVFGKSILAP